MTTLHAIPSETASRDKTSLSHRLPCSLFPPRHYPGLASTPSHALCLPLRLLPIIPSSFRLSPYQWDFEFACHAVWGLAVISRWHSRSHNEQCSIYSRGYAAHPRHSGKASGTCPAPSALCVPLTQISPRCIHAFAANLCREAALHPGTSSATRGLGEHGTVCDSHRSYTVSGQRRANLSTCHFTIYRQTAVSVLWCLYGSRGRSTHAVRGLRAP